MNGLSTSSTDKRRSRRPVAVIDASVVIAWLGNEKRPDPTDLRDRVLGGRVRAFASPMLRYEVFNAAGRRWGFSEDRLIRLSALLESYDIVEMSPSRPSLARWTARGLTAYDASYVALADDGGVPLITFDEQILELFDDAGRPGEIEPALLD